MSLPSPRILLCHALFAVAAVGPLGVVGAQPLGRGRAVLVGVQEHASPHLQSLPNSAIDVASVAHVLTNRGDYDPADVVTISDEGDRPPTVANMERALEEVLAAAQPQDRVIVYFTGHGFQTEDGRLVLALSEFDVERPLETGFPFARLKEMLTSCRAGNKQLVLDCCHAGSNKAIGTTNANPIKMAYWQEPFQGAGVATLASCSADELSVVWERKEISLFTFWLVKALEGYADRPGQGEGVVDFDEVFQFVSKHVSQAAEREFEHAQHPVCFVPDDLAETPDVLRMKPIPLREYLAESAELLTEKMREWQLQRVATLEFQDGIGRQASAGGDYGSLGQKCADWLADEIRRAASDGAAVPTRQVNKFASDQQMPINEVGDPERVRRFSDEFGPKTGIVTGRFNLRQGGAVSMDIELIGPSPEEDRLLEFRIGGTVVLNELEWGLLGLANMANASTEPTVAELDRASDAVHPLADPAWPFPMRVMVRDGAGQVRQRPGVLTDDRRNYVVEFSRGEVFELYVSNLTGQPALMRLLVDGLDTLPKKDPQTGQMIVAAPADLESARAWVLDPAESPLDPPTWAVRGFHERVGSGGTLREFLLEDAANSWANRQQFTQQIGLITAAFFTAEPIEKPKAQAKKLGIVGGEQRNADVEIVDGFRPGRIIGVVNVRYVGG